MLCRRDEKDPDHGRWFPAKVGKAAVTDDGVPGWNYLNFEPFFNLPPTLFDLPAAIENNLIKLAMPVSRDPASSSDEGSDLEVVEQDRRTRRRAPPPSTLRGGQRKGKKKRPARSDSPSPAKINQFVVRSHRWLELNSFQI